MNIYIYIYIYIYVCVCVYEYLLLFVYIYGYVLLERLLVEHPQIQDPLPNTVVPLQNVFVPQLVQYDKSRVEHHGERRCTSLQISTY